MRRRILAIAAVLALVGVANLVAHELADPAPLPLAIDDPETGEVVLWPGALERPGEPSPAAPDLLFAPCPLGPRNVPTRPENKA